MRTVQQWQTEVAEVLEKEASQPAPPKKVRVIPPMTAEEIARADIKMRANLWRQFGEEQVAPDGTCARQFNKCREESVL